MSMFISCDWGTTNLRLRLVDSHSKSVLKEIKTHDGIASVYRSWSVLPKNGDKERTAFYLSFLQRHITAVEYELALPSNTPIVISGMASSSIGIAELEYKTLPIHANGSDLLVKSIDASSTFSNPVYIVSGLCTANDVLRGEETLLAGCDTLPGKTELFIFPGTHSKHIYVFDGKAERFSTYMTGEFFELLSKHSILSASLSLQEDPRTPFFEKGIKEGESTNLLNSAFQVRVNHLFKKSSAGENVDYLSGLLIGHELKEIKAETFDLVTVVSSSDLLGKYVDGLEVLGLSHKTKSVEASEVIVAGHCKIFASL